MTISDPRTASLRASLQARLGAIEQQLARLEAESSQPLEADWSEQANQIEDMETSQSLEAFRTDEARSIRAALQRIKDGTYGICANCGAEIPPARLAAVPTAALCMQCTA